MPKKQRKPRFRVGQVVREQGAGGDFVEIGFRNYEGGGWFYWREDPMQSLGWSEKELRPLTKREVGQ